jgi:hypothetical protein
VPALLIAEFDPDRWPRAAARWHACSSRRRRGWGLTSRVSRSQPCALFPALIASLPPGSCGDSLTPTDSAKSYTRSVSAWGLAVIPQCEVCLKVWLPADRERWQAHWIDNGPNEGLVFYCARCAEPEFNEP